MVAAAEVKTWGKRVVTSGLCREVYEISALLGYYAACSDNSLPTFRENLSVWTGGLSRNAGK